MDFDLTEEHQMIRDMCRDFAREVIAPRSEEMEKTGEYPYDIMDQMAELGMMGIPFPETYGGSGGDWVGMHVCIEELSRGDMTLGALLDVTTSIVAQELYVFGTEDQKKKWLVPIAKGLKIGAFGLTEPDAGSDAASIRTTAVLKGDEWILNGSKQFITNIGLRHASVLLATAITEKKKGGKNIISTFIIPRDAPGFQLGERYDKMAWHASATHGVIMEDCRIPRENLLGDPNRGFSQHLAVLETGRLSIAAVCVGAAQACLDLSSRYAKERTQFGQPIFNFQTIQFKLADMAMAIELARNQYLKAAWLKDQGRNYTFEATVAKLYASEMLENVASDAVQIHGGYGYMNEYPVSRIYQAAKLLQIVEGTSEVQRMVIGRLLA
ncbi:MAG: acyl-CoA dehydrogenase family protein [Deltaproteobacteria bacterium]|nr:acyl-CoA dehydrogenase family protein [Deltaproteobacteria bacterium]